MNKYQLISMLIQRLDIESNLNEYEYINGSFKNREQTQKREHRPFNVVSLG